MKYTVPLVSAAALAGFSGVLLSAKLLATDPDAPLSGPAAEPFITESAICRAGREDVNAILESLPAAPMMNLHIAQEIMAMRPVGSVELEDHRAIDGTIVLKYVDDQGRPHREGGPAIIAFNPAFGRVVMEIWMKDGLIHSEGEKPSSTEWDIKGRVVAQIWHRYGREHHETGPAARLYDWEKGLLSQKWHRFGHTVRPDNLPPYTVTKLSDGLVIFEEWASRTINIMGEASRLTHRYDGLHRREHDPRTGALSVSLYRFHDMETHSDERLYRIQHDLETGKPRHELWKLNETVLGEAEYDAQGTLIRALPDAATIRTLKAETQMLMKAGPHQHHDHGHHGHHKTAPAPER